MLNIDFWEAYGGFSKAVPQLERCPWGGGKFFCWWGHKIEQVGADLRRPKQKGHRAKLVCLTSSSLLISKKKRSSRQISILFCEFSVGPKKTKVTVLKLPQGNPGLFGGRAGKFGGTPSPFPQVAALSEGVVPPNYVKVCPSQLSADIKKTSALAYSI